MALKPWEVFGSVEAGCDEAGRGCLAGPVVASAVILGDELAKALVAEGLLNDSKKLTASRRVTLRKRIEAEAVAWCVAHVTPAEIDEVNILQASFLAMRRAVKGLGNAPDRLLIDGNRFTSELGFPPHACHVRGDGRFASIAAASVLAKTHRDAYMHHLSLSFPEYGWDRNAGYPTKVHRAAIQQHGRTPHHRLTFKLLPEQTTIF
jgi:ribonuclease HII